MSDKYDALRALRDAAPRARIVRLTPKKAGGFSAAKVGDAHELDDLWLPGDPDGLGRVLPWDTGHSWVASKADDAVVGSVGHVWVCSGLSDAAVASRGVRARPADYHIRALARLLCSLGLVPEGTEALVFDWDDGCRRLASIGCPVLLSVDDKVPVSPGGLPGAVKGVPRDRDTLMLGPDDTNCGEKDLERVAQGTMFAERRLFLERCRTVLGRAVSDCDLDDWLRVASLGRWPWPGPAHVHGLEGTAAFGAADDTGRLLDCRSLVPGLKEGCDLLEAALGAWEAVTNGGDIGLVINSHDLVKKGGGRAFTDAADAIGVGACLDALETGVAVEDLSVAFG